MALAQAADNCCFKGAGRIYAGEYQPCPKDDPEYRENLIYLGNTEDFTITPSLNTITVPDYTTCSGGTDCSTTTIDAIDLSMTVRCYKSENIERAMNASSTVQAAATGVVVATCAVGDSFAGAGIPFNCIVDPASVVVTVNGAPLAATEYNLALTGAELVSGLQISPTTTAVAPDDVIEVTADCVETVCLDMYSTVQQNVKIWFDGVNCENNQPISVILDKAVLSPSAIGLITGDEFGSFDITGNLTRDTVTNSYGKTRFAA